MIKKRKLKVCNREVVVPVFYVVLLFLLFWGLLFFFMF